MSYTITIFNHPDMGIDIAGLPPEQRREKEEEKFLIINIIDTITTGYMQYRIIAA